MKLASSEQVRNSCGDLLGSADPSERMQPIHLLLDPSGRGRLVFGEERFVPLGGDRSHGHGVDRIPDGP